jgi:hypothetical protein
VQLSCQCPNVPRAVQKLQEQQIYSAISDEALVAAVKEIFKNFGEVFLIIDAFDECEQSERVLEWIQELLNSKGNSLHLLLSSRQDYRFRDYLQLAPTSILALDEHSFEKDIQLYVREKLRTDPRMMKWPTNIHNDVEQTLVAKAGGL